MLCALTEKDCTLHWLKGAWHRAVNAFSIHRKRYMEGVNFHKCL